MSKKVFKLERRENRVNEIEYCVPVKADALKKIVTNREYMILTKNNKTNELERHGVYSTEKKALAEQRRLNKEGIKTVIVNKEKTTNQYDGVFLIEDTEGNVANAFGLDNALKTLNKVHREDMHLRKQRSHKEVVGYIAFALNTKTNQFVCTRLYDSEEEAYKYISKRANANNNTIRVFRVARYYKGFEFKHQDLDDCRRLKDAKAKLRNMK